MRHDDPVGPGPPRIMPEDEILTPLEQVRRQDGLARFQLDLAAQRVQVLGQKLGVEILGLVLDVLEVVLERLTAGQFAMAPRQTRITSSIAPTPVRVTGSNPNTIRVFENGECRLMCRFLGRLVAVFERGAGAAGVREAPRHEIAGAVRGGFRQSYGESASPGRASGAAVRPPSMDVVLPRSGLDR